MVWVILSLPPVLFGLILMRKGLRSGRSLGWLFWRVFMAQLVWDQAYTVVVERVMDQMYYGMPYTFAWCEEIPYVIGLSVITSSIMTMLYFLCRIFNRAGAATDAG